jgi:cytidine deaminase
LSVTVPDLDWNALRAAAREAMTHAYAPYSKFPVGVAGLVDDGRVVTGCNVENASYGLGLCAECGMVSDLARTGGGRLVAVACVGGDGEPLMPCGRCRQLLWEHGGAEMLIETVSLGIVPMREVLPDAFGPDDLVAAAARTSGQGSEHRSEERARSGAPRGSEPLTS